MIARLMTEWQKSPTRSVTGTRASESFVCSAIGRSQVLILAAQIWQEQLKQLMRSARRGSRLLRANQEWMIDLWRNAPRRSSRSIGNLTLGSFHELLCRRITHE